MLNRIDVSVEELMKRGLLSAGREVKYFAGELCGYLACSVILLFNDA